MPLFLLPVENNEHTNFEWRGGRGVWILLFSEIILQQFCRRLQKKCPCPLNKGVPSVKVTDIKITWLTFLQDQILCPLNGGIPWIEVPKRRYFTVIFIINFCSNSGHLWERRSYCYEDIWWSRYVTLAVTVYITTEWATSIPENTVIWLVHTSNYLLLPWLSQTKLEPCFLTCLITCSN